MKFKRCLAIALCGALFARVFGAGAPAVAGTPAPLRILLVAGGCCHEYAAQARALKAGLEARVNVTVDVAFSPGTGTNTTFEIYQSPDWAKGYDLVVHNECSASVTDMAYIRNILAPHQAGLPAVFIHCAMHSFRTEGWNTGAVTPWYELTGLQTSGHGAQQPIAVSFVDPNGAIAKGLQTWTTSSDELYNNYTGGLMPTARAIALGRQGAAESVIAWTNLYKGKARVFGTTLGHNNAVLEEPKMLALLVRGMLWAADRLNADYLKPEPAVPSAAVAAAAEIHPVSTGCGCSDQTASAEID